MRTEEKKASYYKNFFSKEPTIITLFIDRFLSIKSRLKLVVFPRYNDQKEYLMKRYGDDIIIPEKSVDTQSLAYYSLMVITGGSTFAQEAALQGIPSISYFPFHFYIEEFIAKHGFPLFHYINIRNALEKALEILRDPFKYRVNTSKLLDKLESPFQLLKKLLYQMDA